MRLRHVIATVTAGLAAATTLTAAGPAAARPAALGSNPRAGHACSSTVSIDRFSDALDKTTYDGTFVGNFSALAVDRDGSLVALEDRSQLFDLDAKTLAPRSAVHLADENGADLDSEGLAIDLPHARLRSRGGPPPAPSSSPPRPSPPSGATPGTARSSTGSPYRPPCSSPPPAAPPSTRPSRA